MDLRAKLKKLNLCTIFGICAMLVGCFWILLWIIPLLRFLTAKRDFVDCLFSTVFLSILASPGGFAAYFGFRLIKEKNKQNIKTSVGLLAFFAAILLYVHVYLIMPNHIGKQGVTAVILMFLATIAAIPVYISVSRFLMIRAGLTPKPKGEFVGKGTILIIAWLIWLAGMEVLDIGSLMPILSPNEARSSTVITGNVLIIFVPIIIACIFYKVSMKFIQDDKAEQTAPANPVPRDV